MVKLIYSLSIAVIFLLVSNIYTIGVINSERSEHIDEIYKMKNKISILETTEAVYKRHAKECLESLNSFLEDSNIDVDTVIGK